MPIEKPVAKKEVIEESKSDPDSVKFKEYFDEIVPFTGQAKHTYSI